MVRTLSRLPQFRAAPLPSGPVVGLRPPFLVERGLLVVAIVVVVRVIDISSEIREMILSTMIPTFRINYWYFYLFDRPPFGCSSCKI